MPTQITPRKLCKAAEVGYKKLEPFRKARIRFLGDYVGQYYGQASSAQSEPLNLINLAISSLMPHLAGNLPRFRVRSKNPQYRGYADMHELALNQLVREINFKETQRKVILDALMFGGITKTGEAPSEQMIEIGGYYHDLGQPFCDRISPDDYVIDPAARHREEAVFEGYRYRLPKQYVLDSGLFDVNERDLVSYGDREKNEAEDMTKANVERHERNELVEYVDLIDLWLPDEKVLVTIPGKNKTCDRFYRTVELNTPESGPFDVLGFQWAPDNVMPIPPVGIWRDLHTLANKLARKLGRQADRSKSILAYESSAVDDAQNIVEAEDGEAIRVDAVDKVKDISYGGATDDVYAATEWVKSQFNQMAKNPEQLGGAKSEVDTATQAEILQGNSMLGLRDMQDSVADWSSGVGRKLLWHLATNPFIKMPLTKRGPNGLNINLQYSDEVRESDFLDYMIEVEPYSMERRDPQTRLRKLMDAIVNMAVPAVQVSMQTQGAFNAEQALKIISKELDEPELAELFSNQEAMAQMQAMAQMFQPQHATVKSGNPGGDGMPGQAFTGQGGMATQGAKMGGSDGAGAKFSG